MHIELSIETPTSVRSDIIHAVYCIFVLHFIKRKDIHFIYRVDHQSIPDESFGSSRRSTVFDMSNSNVYIRTNYDSVPSYELKNRMIQYII
jgi:hypothetical protein